LYSTVGKEWLNCSSIFIGKKKKNMQRYETVMFSGLGQAEIPTGERALFKIPKMFFALKGTRINIITSTKEISLPYFSVGLMKGM